MSTKKTKAIQTPQLPRPLLKALELLESNGFESRLCGGIVRDILLGRTLSDYDIATSATPQDMLKIFSQKPFRALPTGIDHGTVTLIYNRRVVGEFTTLRSDVATDGRHADVSFEGVGFEEDALRRDFTVNALFLDTKGEVTDFVGGLDDIDSRTLRFVGNPASRLEEDHLRALRFLRFAAVIDFNFLDTEALKAISEVSAEKIGKLSKERILQEWRKTVAGEFFSVALQQYYKTGLLQKTFPKIDLPPEGAVGTAVTKDVDKPSRPYQISRKTNAIIKQKIHLTRFAVAAILHNPTANNRWQEWLKPPADLLDWIADAVQWAALADNASLEEILALLDPLERRGSMDAYLLAEILYPFKPALMMRVVAFAEQSAVLRSTPLELHPDDLAQILNRKKGEWLGRCLRYLRTKVVIDGEENTHDNLLRLAVTYLTE